MSQHAPLAPDVSKRPRDDATAALIEEALQEEEARKRMKKGHAPGAAVAKDKAGRKGQTLAEIEAAEGGPVKESLVGMAAVQRALRRKKAAPDDDETGIPDDITACEEGGDEEDGAALVAVADDEDMFGGEAGEDEDEDQPQQQQQVQKRVGGRKVPKGISAAVAAAMEGDGGYAVTGFNMAQEREEGNIDEEGNFIPAHDEDDAAAQDAWLNSDEAKPVSKAVAAAAAKRQAAMDAEEEAPCLSETAVAQAQREIASLLQPGESVAEGLRRLAAAAGGGAGGATAGKGKALGKREKLRLAQQQQEQQKKQQQQQQGGGGGRSMDAASASAAFTRLTELADLLLNSGGELGIYSDRKERLERFAAAVLPQTNLLAGGPGGGGDDDGDDMFAGDDDAAPAAAAAKAPAAAAAAAAPQQQQPSSAAGGAAGSSGNGSAAPVAAAAAAPKPAVANAPGAAPTGGPAVDYASWPVKELRRFLTERGVDSSSIVEKADLVAQVAALAERGPSGGGGSAAAPAGYNFDRASGYYYNVDTGLYWDAQSGAFYNATEQKWYCWDAAAGQYKEAA